MHWLAQQGLTVVGCVSFLGSVLLFAIFFILIEGGRTMKKSNMYIQKMFINLMNNLWCEFSCIYLHNAMLANALYEN